MVLLYVRLPTGATVDGDGEAALRENTMLQVPTMVRGEDTTVKVVEVYVALYELPKLSTNPGTVPLDGVLPLAAAPRYAAQCPPLLPAPALKGYGSKVGTAGKNQHHCGRTASGMNTMLPAAPYT